MNPETYDQLPADVKADVAGTVLLTAAIPPGMVDEHGPGGTVRMPVNEFVNRRRAARKRERQNRKRGKRGKR